jgi:hypothetical protein
MMRALSLIARIALAVAPMVVANGASAAGNFSASDAAKKSTNSFNVMYPTASPAAAVVVPTNGTGLAPGKAVVTNPYAVPLFQNAGTLRPGR